MNVNQIRRNVRNVVHNYTDAQVKVREATSNDPWGPSSTLMSQIAEYTHNMVAFTDVMQMVWRRLNDHGKNWRHVYKSLVLLEYLIKVGSDRVSQQCRENIFSIETLKDFQHMEENVDHGRSVREKSKQLVLLLQDEERLKSERVRALKAHQRFLESGVGFAGTDTSSPVSPTDEERSVDVADGSTDQHSPPQSASDVEMARPLTAGEEQLQLQLAIAISQEEAEKDRHRDRSDELRLQMAIRESASTQDFPAASSSAAAPVSRNGLAALAASPQNSATACAGGDTGSTLQGLLGLSSSPGGDPWAPIRTGATGQTDPWDGGNRHVTSSVTSPDPWTPHSATQTTTAAHMTSCSVDPWNPQQTTTTGSNNSIDEFTELTLRATTAADNNAADNSNKGGNSPWDVTVLATALTPTPANGGAASIATRSSGVRSTGTRSPHDFLGENVALVNLDNLIGPVNLPAAQLPPPQPANPFGWATSVGSGAAASTAVTSGAPNPFLAQQPVAPSINQIRDRKFGDSTSGVSNNPWETEPSAANPFLS